MVYYVNDPLLIVVLEMLDESSMNGYFGYLKFVIISEFHQHFKIMAI